MKFLVDAQLSRRMTAWTCSGLAIVTVSRAPWDMSSPVIVPSTRSRITINGTSAACWSRVADKLASSGVVGVTVTSSWGLCCENASATSRTCATQWQ